jgi:DNA replication protein DnaC
MTPTSPDPLRARALALGLVGLSDQWDEYRACPWLPDLLAAEEAARGKRSLDRRIAGARVGRFKPMAAFDWGWPKDIDRAAVEDLFTFKFVDEAMNVVLVGPNAAGKSMIGQNLAYEGVKRGFSARFTTASAMLNDLASQDGARALNLAFRRYTRPRILVVDEVGYLSYGNRHADLFFEVVTRRYEERPIVISTNKPFAEWGEVFPNASCVVTLIDRLVHRSEIISINADSYRLKEAQERAARRAKERAPK